MKASVLLRVTAVLAFVHGVLHTIGGVFGGATPGAQQEALSVMKSNHFDAMGSVRSYWDFYLGYGLILSVNFLMLTVVFWQLGTLAKTEPRRVRPLVLTFALTFVVSAAIAWRYFFIGPAVFELLMVACLLGAWVTAGRGVTVKS
jgi:hypothetical protein